MEIGVFRGYKPLYSTRCTVYRYWLTYSANKHHLQQQQPWLSPVCRRKSTPTLGYIPMKADPDLWMRPAVKPDGTKHYEYMLAYVDDLCGMSIDTKSMFGAIGQLFQLKEEILY